MAPGVLPKTIDYTNSHFIAIADAKVATYKNYNYVVHRTNLTEYEDVITENEKLIKNLSDSREVSMVREQTREIERILETLRRHRRSARSIDILGSALKFVAGTPDHNDLNSLETRIDLLTQNNDKQFIINSAIQDRINELTEKINTIQNYEHTHNTIKQDDLILFETIVMRNGEIISFLNNLALAIVLAKENIVHPAILDNINFENFGTKFESETAPVSVNDILSVSNVTVLQNNSIIFYIIKFPVIENFCEFIKIFPVIHNNTIIKLEVDQAAECLDSILPVSQCIDMKTLKICRETINTCLSEVLNSNSASCRTQSADNIPKIVRASDGAIILNNVQETSISEGETIKARGTLLVTFTTNVMINGSRYERPTALKSKTIPHPPKTLNIRNIGHEDLITLPYIHKLNLENINHIEKLKRASSVQTIALALLAVLVPFVVWLGYHLQHKCKRNTTLDIDNIIKEIASKQGRSDI